MEKELNLVDFLKDCPEGTKLYSTIYGDVTFKGINRSTSFPIDIYVKDVYEEYSTECVTKDGCHFDSYNGECTLFPSKEQRDWDKFIVPKSNLQKDIKEIKVYVTYVKEVYDKGYTYFGETIIAVPNGDKMSDFELGHEIKKVLFHKEDSPCRIINFWRDDR